jgi:hypothetical protein
MLFMSVLAGARGSPLIHIKSLPAGHPPLAELLRPTRNEPETSTFAALAIVLYSVVFTDLLVVVVE